MIYVYYSNIYKIIKRSFFIKDINSCHFSDFVIDIKNCIHQFNSFYIRDNLKLIIIRDVHNQLATGYPSDQKTISFITWNYY